MGEHRWQVVVTHVILLYYILLYRSVQRREDVGGGWDGGKLVTGVFESSEECAWCLCWHIGSHP